MTLHKSGLIRIFAEDLNSALSSERPRMNPEVLDESQIPNISPSRNVLFKHLQSPYAYHHVQAIVI